MNRVISVDITDEYCKVSNKVAGASGAHNAVDIEFTFNESWENTSKKVYFFNSRGLNPVVILLLPENINENGKYQISIPSEPLEFPGRMRMTVKGVVLDSESNVERIMISASFDFDVLEAMIPLLETEPEGITSTQAEQFQAQLDAILEDLVNASIVSDSVDICVEKAEQAKVSETNAKNSEINAKYWSEKAQETAGGDFLTPVDLKNHNTSDTAHSALFDRVVTKVNGQSGNMVEFGTNGDLSDSGIAFGIIDGILTITYDE